MIKLTDKEFEELNKDLEKEDDCLVSSDYLYDIFDEFCGNLKPYEYPDDSYFNDVVLDTLKENIYKDQNGNCFIKNTTLDKYREFMDNSRHKMEMKEERELELAEQKLEKNKAIAEKRKQYRWRNWEALNLIKTLKDKIKFNQRKIENLKSDRIFGQSINIVNKMFGDAGFPHLKDTIDTFTPRIVELENEIAQIEKDVLKIKSEIKLKEKFKSEVRDE